MSSDPSRDLSLLPIGVPYEASELPPGMAALLPTELPPDYKDLLYERIVVVGMSRGGGLLGNGEGELDPLEGKEGRRWGYRFAQTTLKYLNQHPENVLRYHSEHSSCHQLMIR
jgi:hypothetical protein